MYNLNVVVNPSMVHSRSTIVKNMSWLKEVTVIRVVVNLKEIVSLS